MSERSARPRPPPAPSRSRLTRDDASPLQRSRKPIHRKTPYRPGIPCVAARGRVGPRGTVRPSVTRRGAGWRPGRPGRRPRAASAWACARPGAGSRPASTVVIRRRATAGCAHRKAPVPAAVARPWRRRGRTGRSGRPGGASGRATADRAVDRPLGPVGRDAFSASVRWTGIEPATPGLRARCSTSELPRSDTAPVQIPCTGHTGPIAGRARPVRRGPGGISRLPEIRAAAHVGRRMALYITMDAGTLRDVRAARSWLPG